MFNLYTKLAEQSTAQLEEYKKTRDLFLKGKEGKISSKKHLFLLKLMQFLSTDFKESIFM